MNKVELLKTVNSEMHKKGISAKSDIPASTMVSIIKNLTAVMKFYESIEHNRKHQITGSHDAVDETI